MTKDSLEVWIMSGATGDSIQSYNEIFFKELEKQTGIPINTSIISWSRAHKMIIQGLKSDNPPDVFQIGSTWVNTFAYMGYLSEVPASFPKYEPLADWVEETCYYEGKKVAVPWLAESYMLLARKKHLADFHITMDDINTTDSFLSTCGRLSQCFSEDARYSNTYPLIFFLRPEAGSLHLMLPWFRAFGWDIGELAEPAHNHLDRRFLNNACDYLKQLFSAGRLTREVVTLHPYESNKAFFTDGKITFMSSHWWKLVQEIYEGNRNIEAFPVPAGPFGSIPWGGGSMICVSSQTKWQDEAWSVAAALISNEYFNGRSRIGGDLPAICTGFWNDFSDDPQVERMLTHVRDSKPFPRHPLWLPYERIFVEGLTSMLWEYIFEDKSFDEVYDSILNKIERRIRNIDSLVWS